MKTRKLVVILSVIFLMLMVAIRSKTMVNDAFTGAKLNARAQSSMMYTAHSPIVISSDSDWSTYATGGSGLPGNPWVIQDLLIDCAGSGSGITISGTSDYAVIQDCFVNNSGSGGSDCAISITGASHIILKDDLINRTGKFGILISTSVLMTMDSCLINDSADVAILIVGSSDVIVNSCFVNETASTAAILLSLNSNVIIKNTRIDGLVGSAIGVYFSLLAGLSTNATVQNCLISVSNAGTGIGVQDLHELNVYNCTCDGGLGLDINDATVSNVIVNDSYFMHSYGYGIRSIQNITISNCQFIDPVKSSNAYLISIHGTTAYTIKDCIFRGYWKTAIAGNTNVNAIILNNTFLSNKTNVLFYDQYGGPTNGGNCFGISTGDTDYITLEYNYFFNCSPAIYIDVTINDTIEHNWIWGPPHDNMIYNPVYNSTNNGFGATIVRQNYYHDYFTLVYPSNAHLFFPYANLVNSSTNVLDTPYPIVGGPLGPWAMYTRYDPEPLYWAPWFSRTDAITWAVFSSIDGLGIDSQWFKVLLNGNPVFDHVVSCEQVLYNITIQDIENRTYYQNMFNVNATKHVWITIPITTLNIWNNGTEEAYVFMTRMGKTTEFVVEPGQTYQLRVVVGTFTYTARYDNGSIIIDRSGVMLSAINKTVSGPSGIRLDFGYIRNLTIGNFTQETVVNPWNYVLVVVGGMILVGGLIITTPKKKKSTF